MKKVLASLLLIYLLLSAGGCWHTPAPTQTPTAAPSAALVVSPSATPSPTPTVTPAALPGQVTVHFIDVGQGDAILIDIGATEVLIDGGERSPGVVAYLKEFVDGPLEVMVATHPHADHIGGLIQVLESFAVGEVWLNGDTATSATYRELWRKYNLCPIPDCLSLANPKSHTPP